MVHAVFHFPPDFLWGVATASHQVEGNNTANQWWVWEQEPGHIAQGHRSGLACDWWRDAEADFDRIASMGLKTLRLSLEWSRIEVAPGKIDMAALDRYREMLHGLKQRDIEPMVTLHHFTDPLWFAERGGWASPDAPLFFTRYVEQAVLALRDYATLWCTINEPNVYATLGYVLGTFPPGGHDLRMAVRVLRHMLQAHSAAYRVIHRLQEKAQVGIAHNVRFFDPARHGHPADHVAAGLQDLWFNETTLAAVTKGWWIPPLGLAPALATRNTLDWLGLNYYSRDLVAFDPKARETGFGRTLHASDAELLDGGYGELYPEGISRAVRRVSGAGLPIYITENGIPDADDDQRPGALLLHLHELWRVLQQNAPVLGYYHWTLVDNFEWADGWTLKFGLIALNPETQERTPRPSADLYAAIARSHSLTSEMIHAYAPELEPRLLPT